MTVGLNECCKSPVHYLRWSLQEALHSLQEALHSLQDASIRLSYVNMRIVEQEMGHKKIKNGTHVHLNLFIQMRQINLLRPRPQLPHSTNTLQKNNASVLVNLQTPS